MSLNAILGKTWGPIGTTTLQKSTANRGSISVISAFNTRNLIFMIHSERIRSFLVIKFLKKLLKYHAGKHIVLVMDQAPTHISNATLEYINSENRLHVFNFPKRSPEFNPHEKIWNYLKNEELKSHQARNIKDLKKIIKNKLIKISKNSCLLKGLYYRSIISKFF